MIKAGGYEPSGFFLCCHVLHSRVHLGMMTLVWNERQLERRAIWL